MSSLVKKKIPERAVVMEKVLVLVVVTEKVQFQPLVLALMLLQMGHLHLFYPLSS